MTSSPACATAADPRPTRVVWEWIRTIAVALVLWLTMRSMLIQAFHIPSGSMENTLLIGDVLWVNKALYGAEVPLVHARLPAVREPRRLDIVVFRSVEEPIDVVKRVIGMPGDTLAMTGNVLYRNSQRQDEPYVVRGNAADDAEVAQMRRWQGRRVVGRDSSNYHPSRGNWGSIVVPPDSFFVMGDNRDNSYDSRYWGFVGRDRILGSPLLIYYSFDPDGVLPLPFVTAIRWRRLFSTPR